ncbi:hypothetical protein SAMN05444521_5072 [Streptomyces sp. 3214.6]|nr:hypothetical protein SAMN05444521_5072 [Streptomyces sp. 3214.6]
MSQVGRPFGPLRTDPACRCALPPRQHAGWARRLTAGGGKGGLGGLVVVVGGRVGWPGAWGPPTPARRRVGWTGDGRERVTARRAGWARGRCGACRRDASPRVELSDLRASRWREHQLWGMTGGPHPMGGPHAIGGSRKWCGESRNWRAGATPRTQPPPLPLPPSPNPPLTPSSAKGEAAVTSETHSPPLRHPPFPPPAVSRRAHPACWRGADAAVNAGSVRRGPKGLPTWDTRSSPGRPLASHPCWSRPSQGWAAGPSAQPTRSRRRSALYSGGGSTTLAKKRAAPTVTPPTRAHLNSPNPHPHPLTPYRPHTYRPHPYRPHTYRPHPSRPHPPPARPRSSPFTTFPLALRGSSGTNSTALGTL